MKTIIENWQRFLNESSLSRIHQHMTEHDTAVITAFRDDPFDDEKCSDKSNVSTDTEMSPKEANLERNRQLKATLLQMGYGVTAVDGNYVEKYGTPEAVEVGENSFFVVNLQDDADFTKNIVKLGKLFCQDSVLIIPKGGKTAYLHGTNDGDFPGLDQKYDTGDFIAGKEAEFMTRVGGRPFTFTEGKGPVLETLQDHSKNSRWVIRKIYNKIMG